MSSDVEVGYCTFNPIQYALIMQDFRMSRLGVYAIRFFYLVPANQQLRVEKIKWTEKWN